MFSPATFIPQSIERTDFSVLVLRYDKAGDLLVSTPFLRSLREHFPQARIDVLCGKHNRQLAANLSEWNIGNVVYDKSLRSVVSLFRSRGHYTVVVDMMDNPSRTSALLLRLLSPMVSIGFDHAHPPGSPHAVSHPVPLPDRRSVHIIDCMKQLLQPFGIDPKAESSLPFVPGYSLTHPPKSGEILLHISAGKEQLWWGEQRYRALCENILRRHPGTELSIGCAPLDTARALRIADGLPVHILPPVASFTDYCAYIEKAKLLVTPDTSVVHVASAVGTPTVAMYAKPHSDRMPWYPYGVAYRAVTSTLNEGVDDITIEAMTEAVSSLWSSL